MWATVRKLLPLAVVVNLVLLVLERSLGSTVSGGLTLAAGAAVSVAAGSVARSHGCRWTQAIWAAWWLGACGAALNWFETLVGLRPSQPLAPLPVPPGVSPLINAADPNTMSLILNVVIVLVILISALSVLVVMPFALLGYWAYGDRRSTGRTPVDGVPLQTRADSNGLVQVIDWLAAFIVAFDLALQALFRFGGMDPHQPLAGLDARGPDAGMVAFLISAVLIGILVYPAAIWLAARGVYWFVRRARATGRV